MIDTPELRTVKQNTKNFSQVSLLQVPRVS